MVTILTFQMIPKGINNYFFGFIFSFTRRLNKKIKSKSQAESIGVKRLRIYE